MNCYAGFATRIASSFFPRVIPVPQLQPLDARKIFYASPDEEVWKATLVWAEAKAQEREAAAKAASQTDTDESYDSDDSEVGVSIQPVRKSALFGDNDEFVKKRVSFGVTSVVEVKKFMKEDYVDDWSKDGKHLVWEGRSAATIIQAAARGRSVRAWNVFASAHVASQTDKCPYPDSDEDEGDGDYGTDDDDFGDFEAPASKPSKTGCPALGDGHRRLFLCN